MTFDALREEYLSEIVGERIYARVRDLIARAMRRRDLTIYGHGSLNWSDAVSEVLHDFVLDVLIGERQIDYIMAVSAGQDDFDRLVHRHLRRYMARTRQRTVIDNLIDRAIERLRQPPFRADGVGAEERFALSDATWDDLASNDDVRRASALAQAVPKDRSAAEERAPRIYDSERLTRILTVLFGEVRGWIRRRELHIFFELLLTPWTASFLDDNERNDPAASELDPEQEALVNDTARELVTELNGEARTILVMKSANLPDRDVASRLGVSRPTVANRKAEVFEAVRRHLELVDPALHSHVLARVTDVLVILERS